MRGSTVILLSTAAGLALAAWLARTTRGQVIVGDIVEATVQALTPRGIRNNNPGNIRWIANAAARWRGMVAQDAGGYGIFDTPANGVRAIGGELRASIRKGQTLAQAIQEWAPPTENNTDAYVRAVSISTGLAPSVKLAASHIPAVAEAIIRHENGQQPYDAADIAAWVVA